MKRSAYLAFALLGFIWGFNFIFMKWAVAWITPLQVVLLRVLFGFVPVLLYALFTRAIERWHMRYWHHFTVMALLATAVYYFAFAKGTALLLSSVAGMLSGAIPLFSFVVALLFLRDEPLNARMFTGLLLGFCGVLLIAQPWKSDVSQINLAGVAYMVAGSLSVGCSFVYARKFLSPLNISPVALCTYQIGIALLMLLAVTDWHGATRIFESPRAAAGLIIGLGLSGTGVAYILYYYIVARLGAVTAAGATYIPPVMALLIGALAGEPVTVLGVVAMVLILLGVFILQTSRSAPPPKPQAE